MRRSKVIRDDDDDDDDEESEHETKSTKATFKDKINETSEEEEEEDNDDEEDEEPKKKRSKTSSSTAPLNMKAIQSMQMNEDYHQDNNNNDDDDDEEDENDSIRYELLPFTNSQIIVNKDGFRRGSIVRARFERFVTYDFVEIFPGPFLNVIFGPNGTGKSSIACGIALGLATRPQVLGRAKDPKDYIKTGFDDAVIELELSAADTDNTSNLVIRREISKRGPSRFMLNGKVVAAREVARRCSELRIQIDNLCQFLPQDKVAEFAGLTPCQLLEETEKAVGHENMLNYHKSLISLQAEERDFGHTVETKRAIVEDLKQQNARLKSEVDRFNKRVKMEKDLKQLVSRRYWMRFEAMRKEALNYKSNFEKIKSEHKAKLEKYTKLEVEYRDFNKSVEKIKMKSNDLRRDEQERDKLIAKSRGKLSGFFQREVNAREDIKRQRKRAEEREREIQKYTENIRVYKLESQKFPEIERREIQNRETARITTQKVADIQAEIDTINNKILNERKIRDRYRDDLKRITSRERRILSAIESKDNDAFIAYEWLKGNRTLFKEEVFGPIALYCNVQDTCFASYLEMHTGQNNLMSFITLNESDRDLLISQKHLHISVFCINQDQKLPNCPFNTAELKQYGIFSTLLEKIDAPHPVKLALCHFCGIHRVLIGEYDKVTSNLQRLPPTSIYTQESMYNIIQSKYGNKGMSTSSVPIRPSRILVSSGGGQREELDRLIAESEGNIEMYERELKEADRKHQELKPVIEALDSAHREYVIASRKQKEMSHNISTCTKFIEALRKENDGENEKNLQKAIEETIMEKAFHVMKMCDDIEKAAEVKSKLIIPAFQQSKLRKKQTQVHREMIREEENVKKSTELMEINKKKFEEALARAKELKTIASREAELTDELKNEITSHKMSLDDVNAQIARIETAIKADVFTNPRVIKEYEERSHKIETETTALKEAENALSKTKRKIDETRDKWLPPLKEVVKKIDESFSQFMRDIQCEGHVKLAEEESFEKYAIEIYVRFRENAELQRLTEHVQSGGEKSVSTMLYIIALQDITQCPFRLVDEINQGMDPRNERMIFKQVAKSSSRPGLPQCFLVTPKLLADLEYTKEMTVHCVFNGPWNAPYKH